MSDGPLIWVTGASQGIGKALIHAVPWQQAKVIGVSRSPGPAPVHVAADLADPSGWDMLEASFNQELPGFPAAGWCSSTQQAPSARSDSPGRPIPVSTVRVSCSTPRRR
jgi:NAD(P)-dependent dehydrogenase (short-subunit alcohol dehydrogenase family)